MKGTEEVKQIGEHARDELKQKSQQGAEQTQEKAQEVASQGKEKLRQELDQRSQQVAEQVESTAEAMRKAGEELRQKGKQQPAQLFSQGAEKVDQLGHYLKDSDGEQMLHDLEDMVRKKPQAAAAGGLAVGFALSRLLKASSKKRHQSSSGSGQIEAHGQPEAAMPLPAPVTTPPEPPLAATPPASATTTRP